MAKRKSESVKRRNVRPVVKDNFSNIERLWAEDGVVKVVMKDGTSKSMEVRDAAIKARQLNRMEVPDFLKRSVTELIEKIIEVCREAKAQQLDHFPSMKTKAMKEILNTNGTVTRDSMGQLPVYQAKSEEEKLNMLCRQYPKINPDEIMALLRNKSLLMSDRHKILKQMQGIRSQ